MKIGKKWMRMAEIYKRFAKEACAWWLGRGCNERSYLARAKTTS